MLHCHHELVEDHTNFTLDDVRNELVELEREEIIFNIPTFIFLALLMFIGIPGNIVVCLIYRFKFPRSTPRHFIVALACFDLLNCVVGIPFEIADLTTDYFLDVPTLCKLVRFSNSFSSCGSIGVLLIISIDRYKKICRPFQKQILLSQARKAVYGIIAFAGFVAMPALVVYGSYTMVINGLETADCSFDHSVAGHMFPKVYQIVLGFLCITTIIILIILYALILLKIFKQKKRRATMTSVARPRLTRPVHESNLSSGTSCSEQRNSQVQTDSLSRQDAANKSSSMDKMQDGKTKNAKTYIRRSRMTFMMLIVTVAFILGYMPHFSLQIARLLIHEFTEHLHCNHIGMSFYKFFLRSYFLNSAINPIIYSFYNKRFRQECVQLIRKLCCIQTETETVNTTTESES